MATTAYCVKCKAKRPMSNEKVVTMKNGRNAVKGECPKCGTKMFSILGGGAAKKAPAKAKPAAKAKPKAKKK